jgi:hypothetical protein
LVSILVVISKGAIERANGTPKTFEITQKDLD